MGEAAGWQAYHVVVVTNWYTASVGTGKINTPITYYAEQASCSALTFPYKCKQSPVRCKRDVYLLLSMESVRQSIKRMDTNTPQRRCTTKDKTD